MIRLVHHSFPETVEAPDHFLVSTFILLLLGI